MPLTVHQFPCLKDNYGYLVRDTASNLVAAIDTPDPKAIAAQLRELGWTLSLILNTHWHSDHIGGNVELVERYRAEVVAPEEVAARTHVDRVVADADCVSLGSSKFRVIDTGGHTRGHVSYLSASDGVAFVGDTIFAMGCGRLFEGSASQMWASLMRLASLPPDTLLYCAHEYTAANARFALSVDKSPSVVARASEVFAAECRGQPTVPTTVKAELATNPFLRATQLVPGVPAHEAFAELRRAKDVFSD